MARNIELKARCADLEQAAARSFALGAREAGVIEQVDTYYNAAVGRLKLRVIDGTRGELIAYRRDNSAEIRPSDYHIAPIADFQSLHTVLKASLGVKVVVKKRRRLLLWENVRIHLDAVEQLGTFLEFEAVVGELADEIVSQHRVEQLRAALQIADCDLIESSYSDLLQDSPSWYSGRG
jgi:predicted adenylyl cyclase CyaB